MTPLEKIQSKLVGYFSGIKKPVDGEPISIFKEKKKIMLLVKKDLGVQSFVSDDGVSFTPSKIRRSLPKENDVFPVHAG